MTNKTINGVPLSLLKTIASVHPSDRDYRIAQDELRALLDAPDPIVERCTSCDDSGDLIDLTGEWRGYCVCSIGEARKNKPIVEADGIGEPVAVVDESDDGLFIDFIYGEDGNPLQRGDKLYSADQLAALQSTIAQLKAENERLRGDADIPASVKLPERADAMNGSHDYQSGWNMCLDEVRRMNP